MISTRGWKLAARAIAIARQLFHLGGQARNADFQRVQHQPRLGQHALLVQKRPARQFAAQKQIAHHVHMVAQAQILKHHLDPAGACIRWPGKAHHLAAHGYGSGIGDVGARNHLRQRRFARRIIADQAKAFTGQNIKINTAQRLMRPEGHGNAAQRHKGQRPRLQEGIAPSRTGRLNMRRRLNH
jgi:hypothetical protein